MTQTVRTPCSRARRRSCDQVCEPGPRSSSATAAARDRSPTSSGPIAAPALAATVRPAQPLADGLDVGEQPRRRRQGPVAALLVEPAHVVVRLQAVPAPPLRLVHDHEHVAGVIEQQRRPGDGHRAPATRNRARLPGGATAPATRGTAAPREVAASRDPGLLQVARQAPQRLLRGRALHGGPDDDLVEQAGRALVVGVERAQRVHRVAEQLDAHRLVGGGREDVHDAAAPRDLARRADDVHPAVAQPHGPQHEAVGRQLLAVADDLRPGVPLLRRRQQAAAGRGPDQQHVQTCRAAAGPWPRRVRARPRDAARCRRTGRRRAPAARRSARNRDRPGRPGPTGPAAGASRAASSGRTTSSGLPARAASNPSTSARAPSTRPVRRAPRSPLDAVRSSRSKKGARSSGAQRAGSPAIRLPRSRRDRRPGCTGPGGSASAPAPRRRACSAAT